LETLIKANVLKLYFDLDRLKSKSHHLKELVSKIVEIHIYSDIVL